MGNLGAIVQMKILKHVCHDIFFQFFPDSNYWLSPEKGPLRPMREESIRVWFENSSGCWLFLKNLPSFRHVDGALGVS